LKKKMNDLVQALELCEMEAWGDFYRAASPDSVSSCGIQFAEVESSIVTIASEVDVLALNRAIGLGLDQQPSEAQIDRIIQLFSKAFVPRFFIQISPNAVSTSLPRLLESRSFSHYNNWVKLHREVDPPLRVETDLMVKEIGENLASEFGRVAVTAFEWPERVQSWIGDLVGREGWRHYMAFDGSTPVATGALFVQNGFGWLDFASTLPGYRNRGAQSAILAVRIKDASELDCRYLVVETAEETPDKPSQSYRNMLKFGFRVAYVRPNYIYTPG
jgi:hypothetical protein